MARKLYMFALIALTFINLSAFGFWMYRKYAPDDASGSQRTQIESRGRQLHHELGFTPDQARRFRQAQRQFKIRADSVTRKLQLARLALLDELLQDQPNRQRIDSLLQEIAGRQAFLERQLVEHLLAQKSYLTPEQQNLLFGMMTARIKRPPAMRLPRRGWNEGLQ